MVLHEIKKKIRRAQGKVSCLVPHSSTRKLIGHLAGSSSECFLIGSLLNSSEANEESGQELSWALGLLDSWALGLLGS